MKNRILILIALLLTNTLVARNITVNKDKTSTKLISGKVIDKISGEEIAGAQIKIEDKIIYSDLDGNFSASIPLRKIEAFISSASYSETKINIEPSTYTTLVVELESE